jgi:hypothetical protein
MHRFGAAGCDGMLTGDLLPDSPSRPGDARRWLSELDPAIVAGTVRRNFAHSPVLVVVSSTEDGPPAWFQAGRVGARLLLHAAADGLAHDIAAGPVEIPPLTQELRDHLAGRGRPQLLARLGRPQQPARPGRRLRHRINLAR